jgi:hypothetical protein
MFKIETLLLCADDEATEGGGGGPVSTSLPLPKNLSFNEVVRLTFEAEFPLSFLAGSWSVDV